MNSLKGTLKREDFGFLMPITDHIHMAPPLYLREFESFSIAFEMDYESVKDMLPEPLEFAGPVPHGVVGIHNFEKANIGAFHEVGLLFNVMYKGEEYLYISNFFVDSDVPLCGGRENYGNAKKIADIKFYHDRNMLVCTVDRPKGVRFMTATIMIEDPMPIENFKNMKTLNLKKIPNTEGKGDDVCQLVMQNNPQIPVISSDGFANIWTGVGSLQWDFQSNVDPWYKAKITKITGATYGVFTQTATLGTVVHDYLEE